MEENYKEDLLVGGFSFEKPLKIFDIIIYIPALASLLKSRDYSREWVKNVLMDRFNERTAEEFIKKAESFQEKNGNTN